MTGQNATEARERSRLRILVVEDERKLARILKQGIEEQGYSVDVAHDGVDGLQKSLAGDYDAVVLDLMLPGRDGAEVCREIRRAGNGVAILVLTARSAITEKVRLLDLGADDYLTKPFAFAELLARLRALGRRGAVETRTVLGVADLELNPASRRVMRGGREIVLTSREFTLLECLIRHAGKVVTRDMILDQVWRLDYAGGSNIVEVYINHLRRKIDQGFQMRLIQTIRGVGYSVRES